MGCFIGLKFVCALAYADDINLVDATPAVIRKCLQYAMSMLQITISCLTLISLKFLVVASSNRLRFYKDLCACSFFY
jgi:hypothetical protein